MRDNLKKMSHDAWRDVFRVVRAVLEHDRLITVGDANLIVMLLNLALGNQTFGPYGRFQKYHNICCEGICTAALRDAFEFAITNNHDVHIFEDMLTSGCIQLLRNKPDSVRVETVAKAHSDGFALLMREVGSSMEVVRTPGSITTIRLQCGHIMPIHHYLHYSVYPCATCEPARCLQLAKGL